MDQFHEALMAVVALVVGGTQWSWTTVLPAILALITLRAMLWAGLKPMTMREFSGWKLYVVTLLAVVIPAMTAALGRLYLHALVEDWWSAPLTMLLAALLGLLVVVIPLAAWLLRSAYLRVLAAILIAIFIATVVLLVSGALLGMFSGVKRQSINLGTRRHTIEQFIGK